MSRFRTKLLEKNVISLGTALLGHDMRVMQQSLENSLLGHEFSDMSVLDQAPGAPNALGQSIRRARDAFDSDMRIDFLYELLEEP